MSAFSCLCPCVQCVRSADTLRSTGGLFQPSEDNFHVAGSLQCAVGLHALLYTERIKKVTPFQLCQYHAI